MMEHTSFLPRGRYESPSSVLAEEEICLDLIQTSGLTLSTAAAKESSCPSAIESESASEDTVLICRRKMEKKKKRKGKKNGMETGHSDF